MNSYPDVQRVLDDLGDKFVGGFIAAVEDARSDYRDLQEWRPHWMAGFTQRFIANFIHERIWASVVERLDDNPDVTVLDKEPKRELRVAQKYAVRVKRHKVGDKIASYPTKGAIAFWTSTVSLLPEFDTWSLAIGYMWDPDKRQIEEAVLSFRDGMDKPIWCVKLDIEEEATGITWTSVDPDLPQLDLSQFLEADEESEGE